LADQSAVGVLPLKIIVPVTEWKDRYATAPWMVRLDPDADNGLSKPSTADAFQVRSVSEQRFVQRLGKVSDAQLRQIAKALAAVLRIHS
jgi:mRNA interferase MazF